MLLKEKLEMIDSKTYSKKSSIAENKTSLKSQNEVDIQQLVDIEKLL